MKLGIVSAGIVVILAGPASADARAQTDSIGGRIFRDAVTEIARASALPRLDSAALLPGVRREIRIYEGFGFGGNHVTRLVEHTHGVDGQFGVFWTSQNWMVVYSSSAEERRGSVEERAWDVRMSAHVDTAYNCHAIKQTRWMRVCWLPERPNDRVAWSQLLARLDSLGVNGIPAPVRPKTGLDGWSCIVELRTPLGYRVYQYWMPDSTSTDSGERAAAAVSTAAWQAFKRRLDGM